MIRPPGPVPWTTSRSTPCSLRQRTNGRGGAHRRGRLVGNDGERCRRQRVGCGFVDGAQQLLAFLADHDEHAADRCHLAFRDEDLQHGPGVGRGDLDRRLVRLDLHERIVLGHVVALLHEPARDLALDEAFAEIRQAELERHDCSVGAQKANSRRAAAVMRSTEGMYQSSSCQYGYGTS